MEILIWQKKIDVRIFCFRLRRLKMLVLKNQFVRAKWAVFSAVTYNFVALSLQLVREEWNTNSMWKSRWSHVKIPWTTRLEKIVSNTDAVDLFLLWKVTKSSSLLKKKEKWLPSLSMEDTHSEVTIMPLEDLDFLQHQFLLPDGNVSQLLLKQEWLFHVITDVQLYSLCSTLPLPTRGTILQSYINF